MHTYVVYEYQKAESSASTTRRYIGTSFAAATHLHGWYYSLTLHQYLISTRYLIHATAYRDTWLLLGVFVTSILMNR